MNKVCLTGRLTSDPKVNEAITRAKYTLAVDRIVSKKDKEEGKPTADFISIVALGGDKATFAQNYFHKGMKVEIEGHIQTGSYDNADGNKVYTTDVIVDRQGFCESKNANVVSVENPANTDFMAIPEGIEEELPFV